MSKEKRQNNVKRKKTKQCQKKKDKTMSKEKRQKDKQRSTSITHTTKDRVTRIPQPGVNSGAPEGLAV
jgi:hypothetical protein